MSGLAGWFGHEMMTDDDLDDTPIWRNDFGDRSREWRRLFSELFGTFLLVLAGAGAAVVSASTGQDIGRGAEVTAPALTVLAVILFMGKVSGAHLNPVVSVAFALRREFPWRRVPGYVIMQLGGALLACVFLWATFGQVGHLGATKPGVGITDVQALAIEAVLISAWSAPSSGPRQEPRTSAISPRSRLPGTLRSPACGRVP